MTGITLELFAMVALILLGGSVTTDTPITFYVSCDSLDGYSALTGHCEETTRKREETN